MKTNANKLKTVMLFIMLLMGKFSNAQTFDVFIANDFPTSSTIYEFDVFLKSTTATTWAFRTMQFGFYVNSAWLPSGPSPTITYVSGSTGLVFYSPGLIQMNASPSLSAFQIAANSAGSCASNTIFTSSGQTVKVGRFRITSNSGAMNCVPANISMIRPIAADVAPGGNVNLKMAVTKWSDSTCGISTSTTISTSGTYTSISGQTLLSQYNNMAPPITGAVNDTVCEGGSVIFSVNAAPLAGQGAPITYQWYDNGVSIAGAQAAILTISNVSSSLNGHQYTCTVSQCNSHGSTAGILTVYPTNDNNVCTIDGCDPVSGDYHIPINFSDGDACTSDACDPVTGNITHTSVNDGGICASRQTPMAIPYQAVARDNAGNLITGQNISIRFKIHDSSAGGTVVYEEFHYVTTNSLGLFNVNIGQGNVVSGLFSTINWGSGDKFMQTEMDSNGGVSYVNMGTQQMLSVPYALFSASTVNAKKIGTNGSLLTSVIKASLATSPLTIAANTTTVQTYTITNVSTGSTVMVSPGSALDAGLVIAYARVSAANTVEVSYRNTTASSVSLSAGITLYITVVQ